MKFKYKTRKHRGRTVTPDQSQQSELPNLTAVWETMRDGDAGFTPFLNAALTLAQQNTQFTDAERVHMWLLHNSWGHWSPYAVEKDGMEVPIVDATDHEMLNLILFGPGACPFCGKVVNEESLLPRGFRWHRACLGRAYAHDALRFGGEKSKKWAGEVLAELDGMV